MSLQSTTQIFIDSEEIAAFKTLNLHQNIDNHHMLEIVCRMDVLENLSTELALESRNFLGMQVTVLVSSLDTLRGYEKLTFEGIVTAVRSVKGFAQGMGDEMVIIAQSPSFLTEDGPHYASYNDVSLSDIVEKTFREYDHSLLNVVIDPMNDLNIHYSVQHNESAFHYISRLAAQYGEWFYYNGTKLIFGKPEEGELPLTYNFDLKEYHLSLMPMAQNFKFFTNDYLVDEVHEKDAKEVTSGVSGFNGFVANKAKEIFNKETKIWHNQFNDPQAKDRFEMGVEVQKKAIEMNQVRLAGRSDNPGVQLGNIVLIEGGRYRIVSVVHYANESGDYSNQFEAVTAEYDAYPKTNIQAYPRSGTQTAIVMKNTDPDGLSRIRVQFPWQKDMAEMTPWIRIVTPHGGSEKGFHFTPEIGEEVLIGFEGGNAERPYMLGSLYHGNAKPESWRTDNNDIKAIRTRSGHTIEFNDTQGHESITIIDKNKNTVFIDTANNDITISANETMTLNSKNMVINVEENMDVTVGHSKTLSVTEDLTVLANNKSEQVGEEIKIISATYDQEAQEMTTNVSGEITTAAGGKIVISSADTIEYAE